MTHNTAWPNKRLHPTPLRGPEIGAILESGSSSTAVSIDQCGAGEAQAVGPPHVCAISKCLTLLLHPTILQLLLPRRRLLVSA